MVLAREQDLNKKEGKTCLSTEGRVTAMASSNCRLFEILVILATKLVFFTDSSFCCGDVMRFMRLHNEPLVCRRAGRLGRAWGTPACFVRFDWVVISEP